MRYFCSIKTTSETLLMSQEISKILRLKMPTLKYPITADSKSLAL